MRVTYPGGLLGLGGESALLLQLREEDGAEAEDGADAEAAHPADDERGEVLQRITIDRCNGARGARLARSRNRL